MNGAQSGQTSEPGATKSRPRISVIVPVHEDISGISKIRESVRSAGTHVELIIVINRTSLVGSITAEGPGEKVLAAPRIGRGYAFAEGAQAAEGEFTLLLHSDTLLPEAWDSAILRTMKDRGTVGGAFSRSFDDDSIYLKLLLPLGSVFSWFLGDVWGDRGVFVRTSVLKECSDALSVPIMEDVRLGRCMRKHGRVRLLRERVVTSASAFRNHGKMQHTIRFLKCRIWFALGGDIDRIFDYYYSRS